MNVVTSIILRCICWIGVFFSQIITMNIIYITITIIVNVGQPGSFCLVSPNVAFQVGMLPTGTVIHNGNHHIAVAVGNIPSLRSKDLYQVFLFRILGVIRRSFDVVDGHRLGIFHMRILGKITSHLVRILIRAKA